MHFAQNLNFHPSRPEEFVKKISNITQTCHDGSWCTFRGPGSRVRENGLAILRIAWGDFRPESAKACILEGFWGQNRPGMSIWNFWEGQVPSRQISWPLQCPESRRIVPNSGSGPSHHCPRSAKAESDSAIIAQLLWWNYPLRLRSHVFCHSCWASNVRGTDNSQKGSANRALAVSWVNFKDDWNHWIMTLFVI